MHFKSAMTLGIAHLGERHLGSLYYFEKKKKVVMVRLSPNGAQSPSPASPRAIVGHDHFFFVKLQMTHGGVSRFKQKTHRWG